MGSDDMAEIDADLRAAAVAAPAGRDLPMSERDGDHIILPSHARTERRPKVERVSLNMSDAAEALGVSERTMARLFDGGELPCFRIGRRRYVEMADLRAFVERRKRAEAERR